MSDDEHEHSVGHPVYLLYHQGDDDGYRAAKHWHDGLIAWRNFEPRLCPIDIRHDSTSTKLDTLLPEVTTAEKAAIAYFGASMVDRPSSGSDTPGLQAVYENKKFDLTALQMRCLKELKTWWIVNNELCWDQLERTLESQRVKGKIPNELVVWQPAALVTNFMQTMLRYLIYRTEYDPLEAFAIEFQEKTVKQTKKKNNNKKTAALTHEADEEDATDAGEEEYEGSEEEPDVMDVEETYEQKPQGSSKAKAKAKTTTKAKQKQTSGMKAQKKQHSTAEEVDQDEMQVDTETESEQDAGPITQRKRKQAASLASDHTKRRRR